MDSFSLSSLRHLCVLDTAVQSVPDAGHEPLKAPAFEAAIRRLLERRTRPDSGPCVRKLDAEIATATSRAKALDGPARERAARDVDRRYGGLAAAP
ncbi:MAG: hypothetical protein WDN45_06565 [Caulobacteraceae bacterium]